MWECKSERGFTLLEVLIAITILGFITLGVVSVTDDAINKKERTTELNKNNLAIESALSRFDWDFDQIYSPLYFSTVLNMQSMTQNPASVDADGDGQPDNPGAAATPPTQNPQLQMYYEQIIERMQQNEHFLAVSKEGIQIPRFYAPEKNVFEFFTTSNRRKIENIRQSNFAWVRYGLTDMTPEQQKDNEDNGGNPIPKSLKNFTRWFDPTDPWGTKRIDIEKVKGAVLLENVEALEFTYWDMQRRKWETSLRTIQQGESLIRGVKVFITWYDSQGIKRSAERIFRNHWPVVVPQDNTQSTLPPGVNNQQPTTPQGGTTGTI